MTRPLRIAMLAHSTNPRGGVVHALALSEALTGLGHDVVLHAPDAKGDGFFRAARCETRPFPVAPAPRDMHAMIEQRVADYVEHFSESRNRGFDVYHAHDGISGNALATLKARGLHHRLCADGPSHRRLRGSPHRPSADALHPGGGRMDDGEQSLARPPSRRLRRRRDGLRQRRRLRPLSSESGRARARTAPSSLGLSPGPIFLAIGGVEERKNTLRILEAFAQLVAIRPDAELVIAGGASLLDHSDYQQAFAARLARMGPAAASVRLAWRHRGRRHAAPLPSCQRARLRLRERRLRPLRARGDGERRSSHRVGDRALRRAISSPTTRSGAIP